MLEIPTDLLHMLWECPKLFRYWQRSIDTINGVFIIEMDPKVCILGYLEKDRYSMEVKIPINRLLFRA